MKSKLLVVFVLGGALLAFGQGRGRGPGGGGMGRGDMGGMGAGMGQGVGRDSGMGRSGDADRVGDKHGAKGGDRDDARGSMQKPGAWKMLERKTGMTQDQLQSLYKTSGAKNFGQFASAIVVSKNLGLDSNKVLGELSSGKSLGQALQDMGVSKNEAKEEIKKAHKDLAKAEHDTDSSTPESDGDKS